MYISDERLEQLIAYYYDAKYYSLMTQEEFMKIYEVRKDVRIFAVIYHIVGLNKSWKLYLHFLKSWQVRHTDLYFSFKLNKEATLYEVERLCGYLPYNDCAYLLRYDFDSIKCYKMVYGKVMPCIMVKDEDYYKIVNKLEAVNYIDKLS